MRAERRLGTGALLKRGGAGPRRLELSGAAKAWLVALAALLALPAVLVPLQSRDALEAFHNRVLAPPPAAFARDPAGWFAAANRWLADRVYPIVAATYGKNRLAYFAFGISPARNVTVARGGLVFLNGTDAEHENNLVENACANPAVPEMRARLERALAVIAAFGRRRGLPIDVLMMPTVPVLYGDRLPRSLPPRLRAACAAALTGPAPLARVRAPEGMHFVYPLDPMRDLREDPAMFPLGNFHPDGLSVKVATEAFLAAVGAVTPVLKAVPTIDASELLSDHGIYALLPRYAVDGTEVVEDDRAAIRIVEATRPFYDSPHDAAVYRDPAAPNAEAVLMLSDSYGDKQSFSFASAFRTVVQTPAPERDLSAVMDAIRAVIPFDRLVLVFNDGNFGLLIGLAAQIDPRG